MCVCVEVHCEPDVRAHRERVFMQCQWGEENLSGRKHTSESQLPIPRSHMWRSGCCGYLFNLWTTPVTTESVIPGHVSSARSMACFSSSNTAGLYTPRFCFSWQNKHIHPVTDTLNRYSNVSSVCTDFHLSDHLNLTLTPTQLRFLHISQPMKKTKSNSYLCKQRGHDRGHTLGRRPFWTVWNRNLNNERETDMCVYFGCRSFSSHLCSSFLLNVFKSAGFLGIFSACIHTCSSIGLVRLVRTQQKRLSPGPLAFRLAFLSPNLKE